MNNTGMQLIPLRGVEDLRILGDFLAQSKMFGADVNPAQGLVIAGMCQQEGLSWREWSQNFNLIHGVVSKKTDAMLADFQRMGGKHKVVRRDAEGAVVEFVFNDTSYTSSCLWDDIKGESFVKSPKGGLKEKYATPRSRMQMLWARAVSDGLRVVCPQCCQGVYTPEEVSDFTEEPAAPSYSMPSQVALAAPPAVSAPALPAPVQNAAEPTPFADAQDAEPDYSACPIPGKMFGKRWSEMATQNLEKALGFPVERVPSLTEPYRDAIRAELAGRQKEDADNE